MEIDKKNECFKDKTDLCSYVNLEFQACSEGFHISQIHLQ